MKKYKKLLITLLLTLAVVGIGIGLPAAVSGYKDKTLDNSGETLDSLGVSLGTPRELESVSLVRKYSMIAAGETYLSMTDSEGFPPDRIRNLSLDYLDDFLKLGIQAPRSENAEFDDINGIIPVLFTNIYDSKESFYAWQVVVSDEYGDLAMWIDEETGVILALHYSEKADQNISESTAGDTDINIHIIMNFFCERFGATLVEVEENPYDGDVNWYVTLTFGSEYDYTRLPVHFYPGAYYSFNFDSIDGIVRHMTN